MNNRQILQLSIFALIAANTLLFVNPAQAIIFRTTLIGGDLTDPENDGLVDADTNYNATFSASEKEGFGSRERAFNVFDNQVGSGDAKWCCGTDGTFPTDPINVTAQLDAGAHFLTSFTLASGNDTPDRDPIAWKIQGSNNGTNFTDIFTQNDSSSLWTGRNQVLEFVAGTDFPMQTTAYEYFSFEASATTQSQSSNPTSLPFQLNEIEYFGTTTSAAVPFEFSPTLGLLLAGGLIGMHQVKKRHKAPVNWSINQEKNS